MADFTFVIPALNEASGLGKLLDALDGYGWETVVVDNASEDSTSAIASQHGATVVYEPRRGKGYAVTTGAGVAQTDWVFLCDGDVSGLHPESVAGLAASMRRTDKVYRIALDRSPEFAPVTLLTAAPLLEALGLGGTTEPLGGLALVERDLLLSAHLPGGWGIDVALTIAALAANGYRESRVTGVTHRSKPLVEYGPMAHEVSRAILEQVGVIPWSHEDCVRCAIVDGPMAPSPA